MNITLNGNVYDVDRIIRVASEGTRIKVEPQHLLELDQAYTLPEGNFMCVASAGKDLYRVLVKPATIANNTVTYLLSKIVLKKCLKDTQYVPTSTYTAPPPFRERESTSQGYGSHRSQGNVRPRTWNR